MNTRPGFLPSPLEVVTGFGVFVAIVFLFFI